MKRIIFILFVIALLSCSKKGDSIKVEWTDELKGDFSFTDKWSYEEGIYRNDYGQLVCDGLYDDVDTTRHYHTIESEAQCYEWVGTDFAYAYRKNDTVRCYTACNVGTHSSLQMDFINDRCIPQIELNSVSPSGLQYFKGKGGNIRIDKRLFEKGILKAEFDFTFEDSLHPEEPMWWKGKIQTKINQFENSAI